jgi:hypothetical protein
LETANPIVTPASTLPNIGAETARELQHNLCRKLPGEHVVTEYHKIDTVYKRDPATRHKALIVGDYSQDAFAYLANNDWVFTEKVDGTNIRVIIQPEAAGGGIVFGGKTDEAQIPATLFTVLQARFNGQREQLNEMFPEGGCLYGEGYGAKIQAYGSKYRPDQDFVLFDVKVGEWWLKRETVEDVAGKLGLEAVPVVGHGTLLDMVGMAKAGFASRWGDFIAEGIVARPTIDLRARDGRRIITKIKHKDFPAR